MAIPSVYINLEDDVSKIVSRFKHNSAKQAILVCPKRCFLFNDSINLRLLKKQMDLMGKEIFILTMDERGQLYAKEAGFGLKFLPKGRNENAMSDIKTFSRSKQQEVDKSSESNPIINAISEIKHIAKKIAPITFTSALVNENPEPEKKIITKPIPKVKVVDSFFPEELEEIYKPQKKSKFSAQKIITAVVSVALITILLVVFVILPKATVVVYAKTEPITRDMEISISTNIATPDPSKLVMPAVKFDETITLTDKFNSQGKKQVGNKASGSIKIYNFTKLPLNLKASTTTLTVGSKTYVLTNDISGIRVTSYSNAKTKEVNLSTLGDAVEIQATDGGENYNLPAGTRVEITNQVFGSKPELLYGKTDTEITGGTTRYLSLISQDDISNAKASLEQKALMQIREKLKTSDLVIPEKSYVLEVSQFTTDNAVGAQAPSFQATIQVKISGIAYKQGDIKTVISSRIKQTLATNKTLREKTPDSTSVKVKNYDPINQLASLAVHFEGQAVYDLDLSSVEGELVGKSQNEVYEILRSKAEIDKVEITVAPSWQKNFPLFSNKINLSIAKNSLVEY